MDFEVILKEKQQIEKFIKDSYYMNPDMIKFLLIENLALKTLLYEKGIFTLEEYQQHQKQADTILEQKSNAQIAASLKNE